MRDSHIRFFEYGSRIILGLAYGYGAGVHIANMAGVRGFDWLHAPLKWQALDVIYLIIDVAAVLALIFRPRIGFGIVITAALSQIVLYTVFREWIIDVPDAFRLEPSEIKYLDGLVAFHLVSLAIAGAAVFTIREKT
ncbi:MAG: hypothetical protein AAF742_00900 [Pseudomonadota bacterium]